MNKSKVCIHLLTVCVLLVTCSSLAHAQATRTWVSGVGDDVNPCSRTAPCKTFAGAISKTATGGEINVLDPGGFGAVTITKSITISSEGFEAGVLVSGTNGIIVNAAGGTVILRGLDIEGLGTGLNGIRLLNAAALYIEKCTIHAFAQAGIDIEPTGGTSMVFITDTIVRNNGIGAGGIGGILFKPAGGAAVQASLDNVRSEDNVVGVRAKDNTTVSIKNSVAAGNALAGFTANQASSGPISMILDHAVAVNNGTVGVQSNGTGNTIIFISNVTISGNATGLLAAGGAQIVSFGTNNNSGNGTNGAPTSTPGQQ